MVGSVGGGGNFLLAPPGPHSSAFGERSDPPSVIVAVGVLFRFATL